MSAPDPIITSLQIGIPSLTSVVVLLVTNLGARWRQKKDHEQEETQEFVRRKEFLVLAMVTYRKGWQEYVNATRKYLQVRLDEVILTPRVEEAREFHNDYVGGNVPRQQEAQVKIEMLSRLYFPIILELWQGMRSMRDALTAILSEAIQGPRPLNAEENKRLLEFDAIFDELIEKVMRHKLSSSK